MIEVGTNRPRYSNLVVNPPTFDDQGEYVCRARNGTNNLAVTGTCSYTLLIQ